MRLSRSTRGGFKRPPGVSMGGSVSSSPRVAPVAPVPINFDGLETVEEDMLSFIYEFDNMKGNVGRWIGGIRWELSGWGRGMEFKATCVATNLAKCSYTIDVAFYTRSSDLNGFSIKKVFQVQRGNGGSLFNSEAMSVVDGSEVGVYVRVMRKRVNAPTLYTSPLTPHNLAINVGGARFYVLKEHLMAISPFFAEKLKLVATTPPRQAPIDVDAEVMLVEVGSAEFNDFLHAVSVNDRVLPNPSNVSSLAELAYRYGVEQLRADCERHLRYCPDIPFATRLQLAHRFHLDAAKEQLCEEAPRDALEAFIRSI